MLGSIGNAFSSVAGNIAGNFIDRLMDIAPSLVTTALATAANGVLPGSGVLVQAFAGPIVNAGVDAFESAFQQSVLPVASQALADAGMQDADLGSLVGQLGHTFLDGVQQGWSG